MQLDGEPVRSCLTLAVQADGCDVRTIEGLEPGPLQASFHEHHALQCGFCTAGILMTMDAYLREHPEPSEPELRDGAGRQPLPLHGLSPDHQGRARALMRLRSPYDREILLLALPALGALAAEPLYVLVDTAIVGHLGTTQLASLAIAATVLSTAFTIFNFLTYGTTAQVSRLHGAGRDRDAAALGSQALWLGVGIGLLLLVLLELSAPAIVSLMGGEGEVAEGAVLYLRISALGAPLFILASAAQGFLRGMSDLRTPLVILLVAHTVNVVLELLFVYGFDWGLKGSAWGTVIAQAGMAGAFFAVQYRAGLERPHPDKMRPLMRIGSEIAVRTTALTGSFLLGSAVLARVGAASLGAHQIAFQLWVFLALVLDAIAIAGQVMVGRMLGAGAADRRARGRRCG